MSSITVSWQKPEISDEVKGYRITCSRDTRKRKKRKSTTKSSSDSKSSVKSSSDSKKRKRKKSSDDGVNKEDKGDEVAGPGGSLEGSPQEIKLYGVDKTRAKVNELQEGQAYILEIFALLEGDEEGKGVAVKAVAKANGKGAIPKVTEVKVEEVTDSAITIAWNKPEDACPINAYRVTCTDRGANNDDRNEEDLSDGDTAKGQKVKGEEVKQCQEVIVDDGDVTTATFTELAPGRVYMFEVFAVCGEKESEEATLEVETKSDSGPEIPSVCDLKEDHVTDTTITIAWTKPQECEHEISAYRITCTLKDVDKKAGDNDEKMDQEDEMQESTDQDGMEIDDVDDKQDEDQQGHPGLNQTKKTSTAAPLQEIKLYGEDVSGATFSGLQMETTYVLEVYTVSGDYESSGAALEATTRAFATKSQKPTDKSIPKVLDPKVADTTAKSITISWTKPEELENISAYRITCVLEEDDEEQATTHDGDDQEIQIDDLDQTNATFDELQPGKSYSFEIFNVCGIKESQRACLEAITKTEGEGLKVIDAKIESRTTSSLTVSWTAPQDQDDIVGYHILLKEAEKKKEGEEDSGKYKDGDSEDHDNNSAGDKHVEDKSPMDKEVEEEVEEEIIPEEDGLEDDSENGKKTKTDEFYDENKEDELYDYDEESFADDEIHDPDDDQFEDKLADIEEEVANEEVPKEDVTKEDEERIGEEQMSQEKQEADFGEEQVSQEKEEAGLILVQEIKLDGVGSTRVTFSELDAGTMYRVEIYTVCKERQSDGVILEGATKKEGEIDGVGEVKVDSTTDSSITISWKKQENGDNITAYRVTCQSVNTTNADGEDSGDENAEKEQDGLDGMEEGDCVTPTLQEIKLYGSKVTRATFHELQTGQRYILEVFAACKDKESEGTTVEATPEEQGAEPTTPETQSKAKSPEPKSESEAKSPEPKSESEAKSPEPESKSEAKSPSEIDLKIATSSETSLEVTWQPPQDDGNITGYRISCKEKGSQDEGQEVKVDDGATMETTFEDLTPGLEYMIEVVPLMGDEEGDGCSVEGKTSSSFSQVKDPKAESTVDTVSAFWTKPNDTVSGYRTTCTPADGTESEVTTQDSTKVFAKFEGLVAGREYQIGIYAIQDGKEGDKTLIKKTTKPKPVQDELFETATSTSITISWTKPEGELTGYRIDYKPIKDVKENESKDETKAEDETKEEKDDKTKSMKVDKDATKAELTELNGGLQYQIDVYTISGEEESEAVTLQEKTKLGQVMNAKVKTTDNSVTVNWTKPECEITSYKARCKAVEETEGSQEEGNSNNNNNTDATQQDDGKLEDEQELDAQATSVVFEGLKRATDYLIDIISLQGELESDPIAVKAKTKASADEKDEEEGDEWKVYVITHKDSKPANNTAVHLVVYGKDGKTDPIILTDLGGSQDGGDDEKENESKREHEEKEEADKKEHEFLKPGQTDEFDVTLSDIGEIYKIRVGYDHGASWEGWHLTEVKMENKSTKKELIFSYDRWMARDQDDFDIVRELPAVTEGDEALPVEVYQVTVHTGDHWATYTDATLWVNLHGDRGDTGKRVLYHSSSEGAMFTKDKKDVFKVEAVSLGELKMVEIGHDGLGYGAGVFIESVIVKQSEDAKEEYYFPCSKWFDDHMDDGKTERQLSLLGVRPVSEDGDEKEKPKSDADSSKEGNFKVLVKTSDMEEAGTQAKVTLTLCGSKDSAEPKALECDKFENNSEKEFEIAVEDIGDITKIRLAHDNSGESPNWHVEQVKLTDLHSKEELVFLFDTWLASDKGDEFSTTKEVPVLKAGTDPLPAVKYTIKTTTSDTDAGSNAKDVYVILHGEHGDTGKRLLEQSDQEKKFQKGQVDTFRFEALSVGQLQRTQFIVHADEPDKEWFLEKLVVQEGVKPRKELVFTDGKEDVKDGEDGKYVQKLLENPVEQDIEKDNKESEEEDGESGSKGKWTVWVTTGKEENMGSNANLHIEICGSNGMTEKLPLVPEPTTENKDEKSEKTPEKDNNKEKEKKKEKKDKGKDKKDTKPVRGKTKDDGKKEKPAKETEEEKKEDVKFPSGSVTKFDIDVGEIGLLSKIRLILDASAEEADPAMFIEKIKMKDQDTNQEFHFFVNQWLRQSKDVETGKDKTEKNEKNNKEKGEKKNKEKDEKKKPKEDKNKKRAVEKKKKESKDTKDKPDEQKKDEGNDGCTEADSLMIELPAIRPDIPPPEVLKYEVSVHTGDKGSAGTEAEIYITLMGEKGDTGKRQLIKSRSGNNGLFERGTVSKFTLEAVDLQKLQRIMVGHGSEGYGAGWYLDKITVKESAQATSQYVFPCQRWFDSEMEDRKLEREINLIGTMPCQPEPATSYPNAPRSKGQWKVSVKTGDKPDASTKGKVMMRVFGEKRQKAGPLALEGSDFEAGKEAEFEVNVGDIGAICKIEMSLEKMEEDQESPSWYLEQVKMKDVDTEEELEFKFDRWLSLDKEDDSQMCYKAPAIRDGQEALKVMKYQLSLHTGDKDDSNTEGDIYVKLLGDNGNSCRHLLRKSNNEKMFQKSQVDIFSIEAVDPGKIHSIQLENTSKDSKQAWFLDKATIKVTPAEESEVKDEGEKDKDESGEESKAEAEKKEAEEKDKDESGEETKADGDDKEMVYLCQRWIGVSDAEVEELKDAETEATLLLQEQFKCKVVTSDLPDCSTDSKVSIAISGDTGRSEVMTLDNGQSDNFQQGKTAEFDLQPWEYLGSLTKLRVELTDDNPDQKSWHVKQVILEDCNTRETYSFDFNCWLSRTQEDSKDIVAELPALVSDQEPVPVIPYQLQVFTGKEENSNTDSDIYVTVYGKCGNTGKRKLHQNSDGEKPFDKPEKRDVFIMETVSVGEIDKIVVHKAGGSQWFLDKIVLKEGQYAPKEMEFNHQSWIGDADKPDEACDIEMTVSETRPSKMADPLPEGETPPESKGNWELFVNTGSEVDADTDVPVKLTVYGSKGTSDAMVLGEDIKEKFRLGGMDKFEVSVGDIGRIEKIQLEQDASKIDDWVIEKVRMVDMDTKATFSYNPNCWLDWNKGPGEEYSDIMIEIPAIWPEDDKKVLKYNVEVQTSSQDNSDTTANAYISIHGDKGHTGVRQIRKSGQEKLFQKGQTDLFEIQAVDMGSIQKVIMGHDGKDEASAWLIDQILIRPQDEVEDKSYVFKCNKWLSAASEDKLTEREFLLAEGTPKSESKPAKSTWKAHVNTKADDKASTKANVMITVYGDKGKSAELPLKGNEGDVNFESGKTDEFPLELADLGKLYKIRLSHDNSGEDPSWCPEKVVLEETESGNKVTFPCDKWLSRDEDGGEIVREFAAAYDGEDPLPSIGYQVEITTGDDDDAGTEANVHVTLYGERGDSGKRFMTKQGQDKVVFAKDATQTFTLEAVSLGALSRCIVGHDGKEPGSGMYLKHITVKESAEATDKDLFIAERWLDAGKGDNRTKVKLKVYKESKSSGKKK